MTLTGSDFGGLKRPLRPLNHDLKRHPHVVGPGGTGSALAVRVFPPAPDAAIRSHRTRVSATGSDSGDHDRLRNLGLHRRQLVGTTDTVSDLGVVVVAPAQDATIRSHRTRVSATGSNRGDADPNCGCGYLILHLDRLGELGLNGTDRRSAIAITLPEHFRLARSTFLVDQSKIGDLRLVRLVRLVQLVQLVRHQVAWRFRRQRGTIEHIAEGGGWFLLVVGSASTGGGNQRQHGH